MQQEGCILLSFIKVSKLYDFHRIERIIVAFQQGLYELGEIFTQFSSFKRAARFMRFKKSVFERVVKEYQVRQEGSIHFSSPRFKKVIW